MSLTKRDNSFTVDNLGLTIVNYGLRTENDDNLYSTSVNRS